MWFLKIQICGFCKYKCFGSKELKREKSYVFVTGGVKVTAPITVEAFIKQIPWWIGFTTEEQRGSSYDDSIDSFSDTRLFTEKDVSDLSTDFSGRIWVNGKIKFGMRRTKRMKALLHWVQDFIASQKILP